MKTDREGTAGCHSRPTCVQYLPAHPLRYGVPSRLGGTAETQTLNSAAPTPPQQNRPTRCSVNAALRSAFRLDLQVIEAGLFGAVRDTVDADFVAGSQGDAASGSARRGVAVGLV